MSEQDLTVELAAAAGRLRSLERDLTEWQQRHDELDRELSREQRRALAVRRSASYRLTRAVVDLVRNPVRSSPEIAGAVLRRFRRRGAAGAEVTRTRVKRVPPVRPVWLYVAIGLDTGQLTALLATVRQRLVVAADHRPVVVTDNPEFSLLRKLGVLLEYLPDAATWQRHRPDLAWDDVLTDRLAQLHRDHAPARAIVVDRHRPPALADLLH